MELNLDVKRFDVEPDRKLVWIRVILALALCCGFVLSWRLWVSSRLFPLVPISDSLPVVPFPFDYVWFFLLLVLLLVIAVAAQPRKPILMFLVLSALLGLLDQTRWQPWFYQYLLMLAALGFYAWKKPEAKNNRAALNACRLIIVCTYIWSGLQKLNLNFVRETWPDMAGPFLRHLPKGVESLPPLSILIIPLLEICIGLGLITRQYRNASVILAVVTHTVILALLIISGENTVVWPWNIAMALFVVVLFWQDAETSPRNILLPKNAFHGLVFLLFAVLPAFSFIGLWDSYLSLALYSGNTDQAVVYVSHGVKDRLPAAIQSYVWQSTEPIYLDINRWAYGELNVPVYPETRVYRKITSHICAYAENPSGLRLTIRAKPNPITGDRASTYYDCDHVQD